MEEREFLTKFRDFALAQGDVEYNGNNSNECALGQFGYPGVCWSDCESKGVPESAYRAAVMCGLVENCTYPRLAARLKEALRHA